MKAILATSISGAALLAAAPLAAEPTSEQDEVIAAADAFFAALRSDDKSALAPLMHPDGMIAITDKTGAGAPVISHISVTAFLENWTKSPTGLDEYMSYVTVPVDGDTAQVAGPYRFLANGKTTHCGVNVLGFVKTESGWMLGDIRYTMVPPSECDGLNAPEAPAQ